MSSNESGPSSRHLARIISEINSIEGAGFDHVEPVDYERATPSIEVSEAARDCLFDQLGLSPMLRTKIPRGTFYFDNYTTLKLRLRLLNEDILKGLAASNPSIFDEIRKQLKERKIINRSTLDSVTVGGALAFEACQIQTGKNLLEGLGALNEEASIKFGELFRHVPDAGHFASAMIDKIHAQRKPEEHHAELMSDIERIGELSVDLEPDAMRSGAWAMMLALHVHWLNIHSPDLSDYQPSRYKSEGLFG